MAKLSRFLPREARLMVTVARLCCMQVKFALKKNLYFTKGGPIPAPRAAHAADRAAQGQRPEAVVTAKALRSAAAHAEEPQVRAEGEGSHVLLRRVSPCQHLFNAYHDSPS